MNGCWLGHQHLKVIITKPYTMSFDITGDRIACCCASAWSRTKQDTANQVSTTPPTAQALCCYLPNMWYVMACDGMLWRVMLWYDLACYGMIRYGIYGMSWYVMNEVMLCYMF